MTWSFERFPRLSGKFPVRWRLLTSLHHTCKAKAFFKMFVSSYALQQAREETKAHTLSTCVEFILDKSRPHDASHDNKMDKTSQPAFQLLDRTCMRHKLAAVHVWRTELECEPWEITGHLMG